MCGVLVAEVVCDGDDAAIVDDGRIDHNCGVDSDECQQEGSFCENDVSGPGGYERWPGEALGEGRFEKGHQWRCREDMESREKWVDEAYFFVGDSGEG